MTKDDAAPFFARLAALAELFKEELSAAAQTLYFDALSDCSLSDVCEAMNAAVKTSKFFPKPVELREYIYGSNEDLAEEAWLDYKALARRAGGYRSVEIDGVLADTLVAVFGSWEQACWIELSPEMWASKRKEFGRTYRVIANRTNRAEMKRLPGSFERENTLRGFPTQPALSDGTPDTSHLLGDKPNDTTH